MDNIITSVSDETIEYPNGCVYLCHFDRPYKQASHYCGWSSNFPARMKRHREGRGSNLLKVIQNAGIGWKVVRIWEPASPKVEAEIKRYHNSKALCPICAPRYAREKAENLKEKRRLLRLERKGDS